MRVHLCVCVYPVDLFYNTRASVSPSVTLFPRPSQWRQSEWNGAFPLLHRPQFFLKSENECGKRLWVVSLCCRMFEKKRLWCRFITLTSHVASQREQILARRKLKNNPPKSLRNSWVLTRAGLQNGMAYPPYCFCYFIVQNDSFLWFVFWHVLNSVASVWHFPSGKLEIASVAKNCPCVMLFPRRHQ